MRDEAQMTPYGDVPRAGTYRPKIALAPDREEPAVTQNHVAPANCGGLTVREREVVILLMSGMTNRRIAEELYIAEKTVEMHITHSLRKRGLHTRTELAVWAVSTGMVDSIAFPPFVPQ